MFPDYNNYTTKEEPTLRIHNVGFKQVCNDLCFSLSHFYLLSGFV